MLMPLYSQLLVTGGSGFFGWTLAKHAAKLYDTYFTYCQHPMKISGCQEYHLNLQDSEEIENVLEEIQPNIIIHTAALTNADVCENRRSMAYDINVTGTSRLAELAEDLGAKFVYISTDLVFDGQQGNYCETDIPKPCNYYGETKFLGEKAVKETVSDYLIIRLALMYGKSHGKSTCFTDWLRDGLEQKQPVKLYTDQFRTPLLVNDGVRSILKLIEQPVKGETFHLAGRERLNRYEFGKKFAKAFGYDDQYLQPVTMHEVEKSAQRGSDCSLNIQKIQTLLNVKLSDVDSGLRAMRQNGYLK